MLDPEVFTTREAFVDVELHGQYTTGMTVVDFDGLLGCEPNAQVAEQLDTHRLWEMTYRALEALPAGGRR